MQVHEPDVNSLDLDCGVGCETRLFADDGPPWATHPRACQSRA